MSTTDSARRKAEGYYLVSWQEPVGNGATETRTAEVRFYVDDSPCGDRNGRKLDAETQANERAGKFRIEARINVKVEFIKG
jgi:hypothetical protein